MALESFWTFYNPAADCTADEAAGVLSITVPSGSTHDLWSTNNNGPRIHQPANNVDFTIECKMVANPSALNSRGGGLIVQTDNSNWLRFTVHHDGTNFKIFAGYLSSGSATTVFNTTITPTYPLWLRLVRTGNNWDAYRSYDGSAWTQQGTQFARTMTVNNVGLCAMTAGTNPSWTATFDYFLADGIENPQTGDAVDVITVDSFFSASAIYALSSSEQLTRADVFSASVTTPVPTSGSYSDTITVSDSYSASVTRSDQQAWVPKTRQNTNWTDK